MPRQIVASRLGRLVLFFGTTAVLITAGTATTASAQSTPSPAHSHARASQYCRDFMNHLSHEVGVSSDKLQAGTARAARSTLDDAVANGDLTRAQADGIKSHVSGQSVCSSPAKASGGSAQSR
jgi:hypothetical protein